MSKKMFKFFITHKNHDLKKLCCIVEARLLHSGGTVCYSGGYGLHSGGTVYIVEAMVCIAEARSA